jgi:hypothetical protein
MRPREQILNFFKQYPTRRPVSRVALSGVLNIAYPTLDVVLEQLKSENMLEQTSCNEWRPTLAFVRLELAKREVADEHAVMVITKTAERRAKADKVRSEKLAKREAAMQQRLLERLQRETQRAKEREQNRLVRMAERADKAMIKRLENILDERPVPGKIPPAVAEPIVFVPKVVHSTDDAWARVRARHYSKPAYLGSDFVPNEKKMMGSR